MADRRVYLAELASALRGGGARQFYFPMDAELRRKRNLRLGRELGYGLTEDDELSSLYSTLIVINSMDSVGVCVDNAEFLAAVREGIARASNDSPS